MKTTLRVAPSFLSSALLAAVLLAGGARLQAQTVISNLGQGTGATANIGTQGGGETWRRVFTFTTGTSASSFEFTSFTMSFNNASGSPGTLSVGLYSAFNAGTVAGGSGLLGNLSLSSGNPASAGNAVYSGTATLSASTTYYLLLSSASAPAGNNYTYNVVNSGNEDSGGLAGWTIGDSAFESNGNNTWTSLSGPGHFSIQASAIPEPSTYAAIMGLGALGFVVWNRRRQASVTTADSGAAV